MEATAIAYFIWFFAFFQWAFAAWLLSVPRPGPIRTVLAVLFILNGATSFGSGFLQTEPFRTQWIEGGVTPWLFTLTSGADAPTAAWLLFLVVLFARGLQIDRTWTRKTAVTTGVLGLYSLAQILMIVFQLDRYQEWRIYEITAGLTIIPAYGALFFVLGRNLTSVAGLTDLKSAAFLFLAFGSRVIEFTYVYFLGQIRLANMPLLHRIEVLLYLLLTLLVIGMLARLTWSASRRPHGERTELLAVVSASLAIYLYSAGYYHADLGVAFGVFNLLTLVLVRPLFVGLAYDVRATLRISGILGILGGAFFLAKAFAAEVLGQPFWLLGRSDIIALGAVVLVAVPFLLHRATPVSEPPSLTHAQRLALYLLEVHNKHPESPGVTSAEIQEALGISPNNVAGEIRRAEKMLREHADATENLVDSQVRGVRGRKFFRLTEGGQAAAHAVLRGLPRDPEGGR